MVGGAPVSEAFAEDIESDAYGRDAAVAVEIAKKYMAFRQKGSESS
jgi:5-methyltetrahydrofolate--homocysteine methyltransferase